jgi:hypothetical protein
MMKIHAMTIITILFACCPHTTNAAKDNAAANTKATFSERKVMQKLEIKSPNNIHLVVFSRPITSLDPKIPYWGKIEVLNKNSGLSRVVEDSPKVIQEGYEAYLPSEDDWSPDGRYLAIWEIINLETNKTVIGFLDVCTGTWEGFKGRTMSATTDNYTGWREGQPHTMLLIGRPPKWQDYVEALPINEPDPADCK